MEYLNRICIVVLDYDIYNTGEKVPLIIKSFPCSCYLVLYAVYGMGNQHHLYSSFNFNRVIQWLSMIDPWFTNYMQLLWKMDIHLFLVNLVIFVNFQCFRQFSVVVIQLRKLTRSPYMDYKYLYWDGFVYWCWSCAAGTLNSCFDNVTKHEHYVFFFFCVCCRNILSQCFWLQK